MNEPMVVDVENCVRCGQDHQIVFIPIVEGSIWEKVAPNNTNYWGRCRNSEKIVFMKFEDIDNEQN